MNPREKPVEGAIKADWSQVPLPPPGAEGEENPASGRAGAERAAEELTLDFLDPTARAKDIAFAFPFVLDGREVRGVRARRMTGAEVLRVSETAPKDEDGNVQLVHFYAAMTGLPAAVIRALDADDHQALHEGCYPFLPRSITGSISNSTDAT